LSDLRGPIGELLTDYGWLIDNDRLEEWVELFTEDGRYDVIPRDNYDRHLPLCLISCKNRSMIRDRILSLRVANEYNLHYDRHVIGPPKILEQDSVSARIEASYVVLQTDQGGNSKVFSTGAYHALLVLDDGRMRIRDNVVVVDTFCVPTLIATPI
jgi:anthranilate 1,2-dioxygenase small subunit